MSRYAGNDERCPSCGMTYGEMRTGLTYRDVWLFMWNAPGTPEDEWTYKRRGTVLGKWHQIKRELWDEHLRGCEAEVRVA